MSNINPALASAAQFGYAQVNNLNNTDKAQQDLGRTAPQTSSAGNTTVTLSSQSSAVKADYSDIVMSQTVNSRNSVESANINANEFTSGTTYTSSLQSQANYFSAHLTESSK